MVAMRAWFAARRCAPVQVVGYPPPPAYYGPTYPPPARCADSFADRGPLHG